MPQVLMDRLFMRVLLFLILFFPLAFAGLDGSDPAGVSQEVSVTEAGKRPVGRRRKGAPITGRGASTLPFFSRRTTSL